MPSPFSPRLVVIAFRAAFVAVSSFVAGSAPAATSLDLAVGAPDATILGPGDTRLGSFGDRLAAPAPPADLSGDGVPDLIVSGWTADGPGGRPRADAGEVHVLFGPIAPRSTTDLATHVADVRIYGADAGDFLYAEAAADLNGDGALDLVLNAPQADGPSESRRNAGEVLVIFGPFSSGTTIDLATSPGLRIFAADAGDDLNARSPADLDGDGSMDLVLVAARGDGPSNARRDSGEAVVLRGPFVAGTMDLRTFVPAVRVHGADRFDYLSWAAAADFDADGTVDLALGAYGSSGRDNLDPYAGEVHVLFGPLRPTYDLRTESELTIHGADPEDSLGGILTTGDVDGDGRVDLVAGACCASGPDETRSYAGEVHAFLSPLGRGVTSSAASDVVVHGADAFDGLRYPAMGSLTDDACDDLVLGADFAAGPANSREGAGEVYVIAGPLARGTVIDLATRPADLTIYGAEAPGIGFGDLLGIVTVGDATGDGRPDLVASAQFADGPSNSRIDSGEVYVIEGSRCDRIPSPLPQLVPAMERLGCTWPPNHRYACWTSDEFAPALVGGCTLGSTAGYRFADCFSDQEHGRRGDDCTISDDGREICVRSERRGGGEGADDGRRYIVIGETIDACGQVGEPTPIGYIDVPHEHPESTDCRAGSRD